MDPVLKTQDALARYLDCSDLEARSRYLLLTASERAEVLRWVDMLQTGLLAVVPGLPDPVPVDVTLCTNMVREIWKASVLRRQSVAESLLSAAEEGGALDALDAALSSGESNSSCMNASRPSMRFIVSEISGVKALTLPSNS
jgi:hypothetical protein